jgi:uncharacterized protein YqjF (DUF2071 family)
MMAMPEHSWRQLAAIPESTLKSQILSACGITPPPEGISNVFMDRGLYMRFSPAQDSLSYWIVSRADNNDRPLASAIHADGSDALIAAGTAPGTPTGIALRTWMRSKGWVPRNERQQPEPTANTRTII